MVEVLRSDFIESLHFGDAVIIGPDGNVLMEWGDPNKIIFPRSAMKIVQALPLLESGAASHYKLGDKEKFKELMAEAAAMAPDNPDLHYNIGVINMEQGNLLEARASYKKALEINPGYTNAQLNLSTTYVNEGNSLIDEMNSLGNSKADVAKYDELKEKKDNLFMEGATVLEDALKTNPDNQSILTQLKNIYGAMGDNENFMRIKKLMGE